MRNSGFSITDDPEYRAAFVELLTLVHLREVGAALLGLEVEQEIAAIADGARAFADYRRAYLGELERRLEATGRGLTYDGKRWRLS